MSNFIFAGILTILTSTSGVAAAAEEGVHPTTSDAVLVVTVFGPVYVSINAPDDHYVERYKEGAYWLPGITASSTLVRKVIAEARTKAPQGERVQVQTYRYGEDRVWVTRDRPFSGIHHVSVGNGWAWIAGVERPTPAQKVALQAMAYRAAPAMPVPGLPAVGANGN